VKTSKINGFGQNPLRIFDTTAYFEGGIIIYRFSVVSDGSFDTIPFAESDL